MAVIIVAQPKGDPGRSAIALLLGLTLSTDSNVALVDADPNQPLVTWAEAIERMPGLQVRDRSAINNPPSISFRQSAIKNMPPFTWS